MMQTFTRQTEFVVVDPGCCGATFAMTRAFYEAAQESQQTWYCPNGHPRIYSNNSTAAKLARSEAKEVALRDQLGAAVREAEDVRQALLRDRTRFANGVCPCCNRSFENVARHMKGEHPDYDVTKVKQSALPEIECSCGRRFESLHGLRIHQGRSRTDDWDEPGQSRYWAHLTVVTK